MKKKLHIIKAFDAKGTPFTTFIACTPEEISALASKKENVDLTRYELVYTHPGHDLNDKIIEDVIEFCRSKHPDIDLTGDISDFA